MVNSPMHQGESLWENVVSGMSLAMSMTLWPPYSSSAAANKVLGRWNSCVSSTSMKQAGGSSHLLNDGGDQVTCLKTVKEKDKTSEEKDSKKTSRPLPAIFCISHLKTTSSYGPGPIRLRLSQEIDDSTKALEIRFLSVESPFSISISSSSVISKQL